MAIKEMEDIAAFWQRLSGHSYNITEIKPLTNYSLPVSQLVISAGAIYLGFCADGAGITWTITENGLGIPQTNELTDRHMMRFKLLTLELLNELKVKNYSVGVDGHNLVLNSSHEMGLLFQVLSNDCQDDPRFLTGDVYTVVKPWNEIT